jgi:solute carrier family 25 phosphate transporter 3
MAPGGDVHDMSYYGKCMIGGILSCGLTHMAVCPLDIVKCRKQVRSDIAKGCLG